ncbi:MAG: DUF1566 domain-containing protein [Pseudomonadota bacterium]
MSKVLLLILLSLGVLSACNESPPRPAQPPSQAPPVLNPRYRDGVVKGLQLGNEVSDGTVIDNQTGLIWLKNMDCFGQQNWKKAMQSVANIAHGQCGLQDGSKPGMWHLPTIDELEVMLDKRYKRPALSNAAGTAHWKEGDAFSRVRMKRYWSSSPITSRPGSVWSVNFGGGNVVISSETDSHYVWPMRGGDY